MRWMKWPFVFLLVCTMGFVGSSQPNSSATVIFYNGQVLTIEADLPLTQALAVQGDRILAVGSDESILSLATSETIVIDLEGRALMPGFVDAHTHLFNDASYWDSTLENIQQLGLSNGITTLANLFTTPEFVEQMRTLETQGKLRIRTGLYLNYTDNCGEIMGNWYRQYPRQKDPNRMLRILGIKIFADGGSCLRPAISFEYADQSGHGDLFLTQDELNQAVIEAHALGYQVAIHAQGDLAIEQALNALELALNGKPNTLRHRIEHNAFIRDDQLPRYGELGIVPTLFGAYFTCSGIRDGRYADVFGQEQLLWLEDWRTLLDSNPGLHAAWHGDDPGVPPVSPILELYGFITRNEVAEDGSVCVAPDWLKEHAITVEEALYLMTMGAAYALFMEDAVGSLKPGKFADLVVLSESPLAVEAEAVKDIQILVTMAGGHLEFCESGFEHLCPGAETYPRNVARNKPVVASRAIPNHPVQMAVDGNLDNWWGAGDFAPQWIEIDLGSACSLASIRLLTSQHPAGNTHHRIWGKAPGGPDRLLHEFQGFTQDNQWLEHTPSSPWSGVRWLRIETLQSPSWVSWREIEIIAANCN